MADVRRYYYAGQCGGGEVGIPLGSGSPVVTDHVGPDEPVTGPLIVEWVEDRVTDPHLAAALALGEQHYGKCHGIFPMEGAAYRHVDLDYEPTCKSCGGIEVVRDHLRVRRCADCGELLR